MKAVEVLISGVIIAIIVFFVCFLANISNGSINDLDGTIIKAEESWGVITLTLDNGKTIKLRAVEDQIYIQTIYEK